MVAGAGQTSGITGLPTVPQGAHRIRLILKVLARPEMGPSDIRHKRGWVHRAPIVYVTFFSVSYATPF